MRGRVREKRNGGEREREKEGSRLEKKKKKRGLNQGLCVSSLENVTTFWKTLQRFIKILCKLLPNVDVSITFS
jgi:hypothetical protein